MRFPLAGERHLHLCEIIIDSCATISVTRCGNFAPFGRFLDALGHFFSLAYFLLGDFGAKILFTGGVFFSYVVLGAFCQEFSAFSVKTAGHTGHDGNSSHRQLPGSATSDQYDTLTASDVPIITLS